MLKWSSAIGSARHRVSCDSWVFNKKWHTLKDESISHHKSHYPYNNIYVNFSLEFYLHSTILKMGMKNCSIQLSYPSHGRINRIAKVPAKKHQIAGSYTFFVSINSTQKKTEWNSKSARNKRNRNNFFVSTSIFLSLRLFCFLTI